MEFIRKHRKLSVIVLICLMIFLIISVAFGKYILNVINNFILETKSFYFNSSVLTMNNKAYSINNWDGVNNYTLTIDVNNYKNDDRVTKADISYDISVSCSSNVSCEVNKSNGIIYKSSKVDTYQITVKSISKFSEGEVAVVKTSVTSTSPYTKTLSASYNIGTSKSDFTYNIEDSVNSKYLTLNLTNSVSYYEVSTAFDSYKVGDQVSIDDYAKLSDTNKDKCYSAIVTLEFDPNIIFCDLTNSLYINRLSSNYQTINIGGYKYVKKFSFKINASSTKSIIFYKNDILKNYTYPITNSNSIINVSVKSPK